VSRNLNTPQPIRPGTAQDLPAWTKDAMATDTNTQADRDPTYTLRMARGNGMQLGRFDPNTETFACWDLPGVKFKGTGRETGSTEYP
jgi:streptogramin lyase